MSERYKLKLSQKKRRKDYTIEYNNNFRKHKNYKNQLILNKLNNKCHLYMP